MQRSLSAVARVSLKERESERVVILHDGPDWIYPSLFLRETGVIGLGVATSELIPKGRSVILFGGKMMPWSQVTELPPELQDIAYQVADDIFFGVATQEELGVGERINHSCDPNTGFISEINLVAMRDIMPGEDITMDYGACMSLEEYQLICKCGHKRCREMVTGRDWEVPALQRRLNGYFQPYLQVKILQQQRHGIRASLASGLRAVADLLG